MESVLNGKKVLLGISGGIAAYKTASLVRLFIKAGAEVQVIMTTAACSFITPLTLSTLSKRPVYSSFSDDEKGTGKWNSHVDFGLWADFLLIAPATANTLSKTSNGICDNLLIAVYLSAKCPVYFAPSMDLDMYKHPSTINNIKRLKEYGNKIIPAENGELASGLHGEGRMAEPEAIIKYLEADLDKNLPLKGKKILITAGPTFEEIDPVRYIGNHSSGKMGFAIAEEAASLGADVILVSGHTNCKTNSPNINIIPVISAQEMYNACMAVFDDIDIAISAAAVSDYKPKTVSLQKIKKDDTYINLELEKTTDILYNLGKNKKQQFLVGFALETENEIENAKIKIGKKNLDLMVLNSLKDEGAGFGDTNKITFIDKEFNIEPMELKSKTEVAADIMQKIIDNFLTKK